jgi:putative oxidoreductase
MFSLHPQILPTHSDKTTLLIRLMVGLVFFSEGLQKFILPEIRGAGRFESIGLPSPELLGHFVGFVEILCGLLVLIGLYTRLASVPLLVIMMVAFASTKSEVFIQKGFWELLHGSRTDWSMTLGSLFLLIKGGGKWSIDLLLFTKHQSKIKAA